MPEGLRSDGRRPYGHVRPRREKRLRRLADVGVDRGVITRGLGRSGDGWVVRKECPLLPAPDAFAEDCTAGYAGEQSRRQKDVVDLVALGAVTEGAGSAVARETRMGG